MFGRRNVRAGWRTLELMTEGKGVSGTLWRERFRRREEEDQKFILYPRTYNVTAARAPTLSERDPKKRLAARRRSRPENQNFGRGAKTIQI
jgi:hypothetical protein